ncbi:MAG: hypothetical protein QM771_04145 [Nitrospira sp.]
MGPECDHEYQLECVGGVYLTGAYVCRLCSFRISMSDEQFTQHAQSSRHYQTTTDTTESEAPERESTPPERRSRKIPPTCLLLSQIDTLIELCAIGM